MLLIALSGVGLLLVVVALGFMVRWKWKDIPDVPSKPILCLSCTPSPVCCSKDDVVQLEVEEKDSLDEQLDILSKKLANKEGRLLISKCRMRQTQNEIENLHALDHDVRSKYQDIMNLLRKDLQNNERDCRKLQEQIECVSRRRAELKEEVRCGQKLYGDAAAELATNLTELQRGRTPDHRVLDKTFIQQCGPLRHRKEPSLLKTNPVGPLIIKSSPQYLNGSCTCPLDQ